MAECEECETCDEDCNERGIGNSERTYNEVYNYLTDSQYPKQAMKADKAVCELTSLHFMMIAEGHKERQIPMILSRCGFQLFL